MKEFGLIIKLLLVLLSVVFLGDYIPLEIQSVLLTFSTIIKEILSLLIPFVVFAYLSSCLLSFEKNAPMFLCILLALIAASNYVSTWLGYGIGEAVIPHMGSFGSVVDLGPQDDLEPLFSFRIPKILTTDVALILGAIVGIMGSFKKIELVENAVDKLKNYLQWGLTKLFIPILPYYILGFLLKVQHDNSLPEMFTQYAPLLILIIASQAAVMIGYFLAGTGGKPQQMLSALKVTLPVGLVGFSTISSAATMPVTLEAAKINTGNTKLSQVVIPMTANIHLVADSICVPLLISAVYVVNGMGTMGISDFFIFSAYYMLSKFGVAAIPGGGMIVILPLLESQFGFTTPMSSLIFTLYVLLDPFITAFNVMSNSAFVLVVNKICAKFGLLSKLSHQEKTA